MEKLIKDNLYLIRGGRLNNNSYIIFKNDYAIVIDPSFNVKAIQNFLEEKNINKIAILVTHYHYDHMGELIELANIYPNTNIYMGKQEEYYLSREYSNVYNNLLKLLNNELFKANLVYFTKAEEKIVLEDIQIKAIHTPAHTIGSYTYNFENIFFTGDFIFSDTIGFLDEANDGINLFISSIHNLMNYLSLDSLICPGHNNIAEWSEVKRINQELKTYGKVN